MGDLGVASPTLLLARIDVELDAQAIIIEGKDLRLLELDSEKARIEADTVRAENEAAALAKTIAKLDDGIEARKARIRQHEFLHVTKKNTLRLLELAEEREAIANDIEASRLHIAKLEAEASQQRARLKESTDG